MKNTARFIIVYLFLLSVAHDSFTQEYKGTRLAGTDNLQGIDRPDAILISKYMILTGNEAMLITDAKKINRLVSLLINNRSIPHACAYHWLIWFRQQPTRAVPISHNEECEEYIAHNNDVHSLLKTYFKTIKEKPTHFIFNVKVPASLEPEEAVRKLEDNTRYIFFFQGTEQRLPSIKIQAIAVSDIPESRKEWDTAKRKNLSLAEAKIMAAIKYLRSRYNIIKTTKLDNRHSRFGGGKIEDRVETTLYFSYETAFNDIREGLKEVNILDQKKPTYYILQMVAQEKTLDKIKQEVMSKHECVLDMFKYPDVR